MTQEMDYISPCENTALIIDGSALDLLGISKVKKTNVLLEDTSFSMRLAAILLRPYSHPISPQTFTQSQLLRISILKPYLKTTYHGVI